jgi:hypothetical protein
MGIESMAPLAGRPDLVVPHLESEFDDPELAYHVRMTIAVVHGKSVCTSITVTRRAGGAPVTRQGLNSLPVNQLVRQAVATRGRRADEG